VSACSTTLITTGELIIARSEPAIEIVAAPSTKAAITPTINAPLRMSPPSLDVFGASHSRPTRRIFVGSLQRSRRERDEP
jgi:hypothetical protein